MATAVAPVHPTVTVTVPASSPNAPPSPPVPTTRAPGVALDGAAYDPAAGTWRTLPAVATPDGFVPHPLTATGDRLTVMFTLGTSCASSTPEPDPMGAWYDRAGARWESIPAVGAGVAGCAPVGTWAGGRLWLVSAGAIHGYDPATGAWTPVTRSPEGYGACFPRGVHAFGDRVVAEGARPVGPESSVTCLSVFDPSVGSWEELPEPSLLGGQVVVSGDELLIYDAGTAELARWDDASRTWEARGGSPTGPRSGSTVVASATSLVVWGGFDVPRRTGPPSAMLSYERTATRGDGAVYDVADGTWRTIPAGELSGRVDPAATVIGDATLFVWGGSVVEPTPTGSHRVSFADGATFALAEAGDRALPPPATTATASPSPPSSGFATGGTAAPSTMTPDAPDPGGRVDATAPAATTTTERATTAEASGGVPSGPTSGPSGGGQSVPAG